MVLSLLFIVFLYFLIKNGQFCSLVPKRIRLGRPELPDSLLSTGTYKIDVSYGASVTVAAHGISL